MKLSHVDAKGRAHMVDVGDKEVTSREAVARATIRLRPETLALILAGEIPKGDVLATARLAGIMAAKRTWDLIPLCHPLELSAVEVSFRRGEGQLEIQAVVRTTGRTGAEMEALTAVSVAALTVYDMCKAVEKGMTIDDVRLVKKSGGRSGEYRRPGEEEGGFEL